MVPHRSRAVTIPQEPSRTLDSHAVGLRSATYAIAGHPVLLETNAGAVLELAGRLWDRGDGPSPATPLRLSIAVDDWGSRASSLDPTALAERWTVLRDDLELAAGSELSARIACRGGRMEGRVSARFLARHPAVVARLLLETPAAAMLARRGYGALHAGAVTGPGGAVVIRGAAGTGKSTLVAAAFQAGLGVIGDEALLAARNDPDELVAGVREVSLLPDAVRLLGLSGRVSADPCRPDGKWRVDLVAQSTPAVRRARRVATVILGAREPGPARFEVLHPESFLREFRRGAIPQERWSGTPTHIASQWARGARRLVGAADLAGAVTLLRDLVIPCPEPSCA